MKQVFSIRFTLAFTFLLLVFSSCKKVNLATTLGGGLVPEIDNINTFDTAFAAQTDNAIITDTAKLGYGDAVAVGNISSDPEFGQTTASAYFQINPTSYGNYPFIPTGFSVDSVVLSLDFVGSYGDANVPQTVHVYEVAQTSGFNDTTFYYLNGPEIETAGAELGSATFTINTLKDSVTIIRNDTVRVANQLRIRLSNSLGSRLASFDTSTGPNGGYHNDAAFKSLFRGLAIKPGEGMGNALAFFSLVNTGKTALTVYYKATTNGLINLGETTFTHAVRNNQTAIISKGGQANTIKRQRAGGWDTYLNNGTAQDDKLYIQSSPGSAGLITIPGLDVFKNKLIHRAELITTRIPSALDNIFTAPAQLFLDKAGTNDSAFIFSEYLVTTQSIPVFDFSSFGGKLRTDNTYRFDLTKAVQDIITRDSSNLGLRIYAPFDARPFDTRTRPAIPRFVQAIPYPAAGRVVLAGGNYSDPNLQLRLHVIYSNL